MPSPITPFVKRFVEDSVKQRNLHDLLEQDGNKPSRILYDNAVNISLEVAKLFPLAVKTTFFPSIYDSEEFIANGVFT